jgi:uncharacterized protein (DUF1330 family)
MPASLISQVEVLDPEAWENHRTRAAPAIARFGVPAPRRIAGHGTDAP